MERLRASLPGREARGDTSSSWKDASPLEGRRPGKDAPAPGSEGSALKGTPVLEDARSAKYLKYVTGPELLSRR
jgi:hypothetical protein